MGHARVAVWVLVFAAACGGREKRTDRDAGRRDAGTADAGIADGGPDDAGAIDAGPADAGPFDAGPHMPPMPVVAWQAFAGGAYEIYVRRWNGSEWEELAASGSGGGISNSAIVAGAGESRSPRVALDPSGNPVVVWTERNAMRDEIYLRRWTGSDWEQLGGSASGEGLSTFGTGLGASDPAIAIDSAGRIVVAYKAADTPGGACCALHVYAKRWNGTTWEELGGSASGGGVDMGGSSASASASAPSVAIDSMDRPVIAWNAESSASCAVFLRRWSGAAWEELAGSATGGGASGGVGGISDPSLAIGSDDRPVVAWLLSSSSGFRVRRFDGSGWPALGPSGVTSSCTAGAYMEVAVDSSDAPVVATYTTGGTGPIGAQRWNGTSWDDLAPTGTGNGFTAIAAAPEGELYLGWSGATGAIHVLHWTGREWEELAASGSGSGISGSTGAGYGPSIAASLPR